MAAEAAEDAVAAGKEASPRGPATPPGAVSRELWDLIQRRPAGGDWARALEAADPTEREVLLGAWLEVDAGATLRWYARERRAWAEEPLDAWLPHAEPRVLRRLIESGEWPILGEGVASIFEQSDGPALARVAAEDPRLLARLCLLNGDLLQKWSEIDPTAEAQVRAVATPSQRLALDVAQRRRRADADPEEAKRIMQALPVSAERTKILEGLLETVVLPFPDEPAERTKILEGWLGRVEAEEAFALMEREVAAGGGSSLVALRELRDHDAERAADLARRAGISEDEVQRLLDKPQELSGLFPEWLAAKGDLAKQAAVLSADAGESIPLSFYGQTSAAWVGEDPVAASQWVTELPPGAPRDAAISSMAQRLVDAGPARDFDGAFAWSATISDASQRTASTLHVLRRWMDRDPAAAEAALNSGSLPEDTRTAVAAELGLQP